MRPVSSRVPSLGKNSIRLIPLEGAHERLAQERIVIDLPSLPLTPGEYYLTGAAGIDPRVGGVIIDEMDHAAEFSVIGAGALGTGHRFGANDGLFLVPRNWEIRASVPDRGLDGALPPR